MPANDLLLRRAASLLTRRKCRYVRTGTTSVGERLLQVTPRWTRPRADSSGISFGPHLAGLRSGTGEYHGSAGRAGEPLRGRRWPHGRPVGTLVASTPDQHSGDGQFTSASALSREGQCLQRPNFRPASRAMVCSSRHNGFPLWRVNTTSGESIGHTEIPGSASCFQGQTAA